MAAKSTDSFGQEVCVGDYVYFRIKSKYVADAISLGYVRKVSPTGALSLRAINTHGKTFAEHAEQCRKRAEQYAAEYTALGKPIPGYLRSYMDVTFDTRLADASSTIKIPAHALDPQLTQALQ